MSKNRLNTETHPDWYFDIPVMKVLILGSFPPHESKRDYPFYYPNKQNNFWKILAQLNSTPLNYFSGQEAVKERQQLMLDLKVGVQNLGRKIARKGLSSRDTDIVISEFQDVLSIIRNHPELKKILIAGYSAENSTYRAFLKYLDSLNIKYTFPKVVQPNESFHVFIDDRRIQCLITNSTSTAARIKFEILVEQFYKALFD